MDPFGGILRGWIPIHCLRHCQIHGGRDLSVFEQVFCLAHLMPSLPDCVSQHMNATGDRRVGSHDPVVPQNTQLKRSCGRLRGTVGASSREVLVSHVLAEGDRHYGWVGEPRSGGKDRSQHEVQPSERGAQEADRGPVCILPWIRVGRVTVGYTLGRRLEGENAVEGRGDPDRATDYQIMMM